MTHGGRVIAITGGIGSGKSVVSRVLVEMGYPVYDCDSRARDIMDNDCGIKRAIADNIGVECIVDGMIDRSRLSRIVFNDSVLLSRLNEIVHSAVRDDLKRFIESVGGYPCFVETAILYQSGIDLMVDEVWEVTAPVDVRIERVAMRNGLSEREIRARISSQDSYVPVREHANVKIIVNDNFTAVLPQVNRLLITSA